MATRDVDQERVETAPRGTGNGVATLDARTGPRKRIIFGVLGAIAGILILVWGMKWYAYAHVHEGTDDARVDADAVQITSKIGERVETIVVDTNEHVAKNQTLIVLDNADERAKLKQAQANYDLARSNQSATTQQSQGGLSQAQADVIAAQTQLPITRAGVAQAQAQLDQAQAQVPAAQAAADKASADEARAQSLFATGDVPRAQLDAMRAAAAAAAAQLRAARESVLVASANLDAARVRIASAQAGISAAQGGMATAQGKLAQNSDPSNVEAAAAALALAKQNLSYTSIVSPIDGYVGEKSAEVGQTVGPGTTLLTLIPSNKIFITANFKETQLTDMRVGQPADIHVDAYPNAGFTGHVVSINPASQNTYALVPAQNATGNFVKVTQRIPVRIAIDNGDAAHPLRPGMSVETYVKVR